MSRKAAQARKRSENIEAEQSAQAEIPTEVNKGDENDGPMPVKWCSVMTLGIPQQEQHRSHHETLIDVVPRLNHHSIQAKASIGG